jgi:hypothetical protein
MAVKGYVSVSPDRAVSKQQQLAAIAAQNAEIKTSFPRTPNQTVVIKKRKSNPPDSTPKSSQN